MVGAAAWNLAELVELRAAGGLDAVAARLAEPAGNASGNGNGGSDGDSDASGGEPAAQGAGRTIRMSTGYEMNPWADLQPPGTGPATGRKLWHSSPGSAG